MTSVVPAGELTVRTRKTLIPILLFFFLSVTFASPLFAQDGGNPQDSGNPPGRVERLSYMEGSVSFEPAGENDWSLATLNYPLTSGDRLWADKAARAELETGNIAIRMSEQTDLTTTNLTDQLLQLGLAQGSLRITAYDLRPGGQVEVDTPSAAVTIVQPGNYRVDVYPDQNRTLVTVNRGEVQITGNGINQTVQSGQAVMLNGTGNAVQVSAVAVPAPDSFDQWCAQRDPKYQNARSRQYVSPYVPGYYDLDGYGTWSTVATYGPIWYPAGIPIGWCPYRYGRWAWVEPWGWTWVDAAPWGFAPFHYGRWVQVGVRWGWLPGPIAVAPIYGPAFVAFVGGAGFSVGFGIGGVAAWFPLGPGEPFYPWYHYSGNYLRQINVTNVRNINITNINVTNINNVHYRYQTVAATAVSANAFRNSEPVERNLVKVNPQQLQHAQVIPHPEINPTAKALAAGNPSAHPPVRAERPAVVQHAPVVAHAGQPATAARVAPPANVRPNENVAATRQPTPPAAEHNVPQPPANRPATPANVPEAARNQPPASVPRPATPANPARGTPPPSRPALVARTPPPPPKLTYEQKMPAMEQHPGRPLEPQQKANLHAGQPAGPMRDTEFPPHAAPERAAPSPHAAPHGEPPKH
jgi:uncharacterized protein DUF6600